jgi:hypothetical protein
MTFKMKSEQSVGGSLEIRCGEGLTSEKISEYLFVFIFKFLVLGIKPRALCMQNS